MEQGWSSRLDRKLWRFLARNTQAKPFRLAGASACCSITFDDVPESAASVGAPILEAHGARGTFYVAASTCGRQDVHWRVASREQVRAVAAAGHEVACHTARHVNVQSLAPADLAAECDRNAAELAELTGRAPSNFAYPFGDLGYRQVRMLAGRFRSCRTIYERLNVGTIDLGLVSAIGLFDRTQNRAKLKALIAEAVARKAWLVFYTHDVLADPTFMGTSPALMNEALTLLAQSGVPVLTVDAALTHHGLPAR